MKKTIIIALASFILGLLVAGYVFVYSPEKKSTSTEFLGWSDQPGVASALYAAAPEASSGVDFTTIAAQVGPAVVKLESERVEKQRVPDFGDQWPFEDFWDRFFGTPRGGRDQEFKSTAMGTGFFISSDGYILTNNHLVENATQVKVFTVQGDDFVAKVRGTDPRTDLALLKIEGKDFPFAVLGDSAQVKVGEWVLAIGNPLGMEHTVTSGIVSAKGRQLGVGENTNNFEDFIQTDAAINRGNSGGPLVNMKGEVIGINSNILTPSGGNVGIGFAIPSNMAKKVVAQLKEKGRVVRGKLGVIIQNIDEGLKENLKLDSKKGALVNTVEAGGPADKAGLKQYDVIIALNGAPVESMNDLRLRIADTAPGTKIEITYIREGKVRTTTATITVLDEETGPKEKSVSPQKDIGVSLTAMTPAIARRYGYRTTEGLLITEVQRGSEAARKGLQDGDIIVQVNQKAVTTVKEFEDILDRTASGKSIMLLVRRESDGLTQDTIVTLRVP